MSDKTEDRLFDLAKQQDMIMHNLSSELGVKTSLYLVFSAFIISASIQIINFSKDTHSCSARYAVIFCALGAAIALIAGFALLIAAAVRDYSVFPASSMVAWLKKMEAFRSAHPGAQADPLSGLTDTLVRTVDENQAVNEKRARWIQRGTWLLFASLPFTAIGGFFAVCAYLSLPS